MAVRKRKETAAQKRYTRRSTKKRLQFKPSPALWRIIAGVLGGISVIVLALVLGTYLQSRSEAYRESQSEEWNPEQETVSRLPAHIPDIRAIAITPRGDVGGLLIAGRHGGVLIPLADSEGTLLYASAVGQEASLPLTPSAPSLQEDIARVAGRGLNVTCTFTVNCLSEEDPARAAYLRGLELALLYECAEASPHDILLFGLPAGTDQDDRQTAAFLDELRALLSGLDQPPAVGVVLSPADLTSPEGEMSSDGQTLYAGNPTPARLLTRCDYLALELRGQTAQENQALLSGLRYAYARYSLCLVVDMEDSMTVAKALETGYTRLFEMPPLSQTSAPEENHP